MSGFSRTINPGALRGLAVAVPDVEPLDPKSRGAVLIVANSRYRHYPALIGPPNDLEHLGRAFKAIGLSIVTVENIPDRHVLFGALVFRGASQGIEIAL